MKNSEKLAKFWKNDKELEMMNEMFARRILHMAAERLFTNTWKRTV